MSRIFIGCFLLCLFSCTGKSAKEFVATDTLKAASIRQYTLAQKRAFIDSIGNAQLQSVKDSLSFEADSIFKSRTNLQQSLSGKVFNQLRLACSKRFMPLDLAKQVFADFDIARFEEEGGDSVEITFIPFGKDRYAFDEYAISIGDTNSMHWGNTVYFFKANTVIARHDIRHRYGLQIRHYKGPDDKTIVYYKQNFESGSGIWHFNYYFYQYNHKQLVPVLNVPQDIMFTWPRLRHYWLETAVISQDPLRFKLNYTVVLYGSLPQDSAFIQRIEIIKDSTILSCKYNPQQQQYEAEFDKSIISKDQLLSYYLGDNHLLFVMSHSKALKDLINSTDPARHRATSDYINAVMDEHLR